MSTLSYFCYYSTVGFPPLDLKFRHSDIYVVGQCAVNLLYIYFVCPANKRIIEFEFKT